MNLLLIDSDAIFGADLRDDLKARGHTLEWASDGREGIARAASFSFDAVILDLVLPDMCGIALCAALRDKSWSLPILVLSERNDLSDRLQSFEVGADDVMAKPFDLDELIARLKAIQRPVWPPAKPLGPGSNAIIDAGAMLLDRLGRWAPKWARTLSIRSAT